MENFPNPFENKSNEKEQRKKEFIALAIELSEAQESFPFPGIDGEAYSKMKADEEEFPGYTTPIDELIKRFEQEGMKITLGKYPGSGNIFILPAQSNDIETDGCISFRQLQTVEGINEKLKKLILLDQG